MEKTSIPSPNNVVDDTAVKDENKKESNVLDRCSEFKKLALENMFVKFVADKLAEQCNPKAKIEDFIQW